METATTSKLNRIVKEIDGLDYVSQLDILVCVTNNLKKGVAAKPRPRLVELKGLGKELWAKTNVDSYIANERGSWD
ncbi:MAG: hypothetical protein LBS63_01345 [Prevotellaceae bacterium]|jgi:hypothetical protein|nr:hypothetical protein [Prevotellaceae bacterium]